jgi:hypothetical protein
MPQYSTHYVGLDVHNDPIAVAYVARDHGAEVISLGLSAHGTPTSINSPASFTQRPNASSLSMKQAHVPTGSIAI